ncbi:hypothetical protein [Gimesia chilikensis]|uniref:hypothetical protein n=1 Tax=Gimesia chilikensis TaxID=2605989 RepID=UPI003A8E4DE7
MSQITQINISKELGTFLQGRPLGKKHYARLCELLSETPQGEVVILNFSKVKTATGSWINECLVPLLKWSADERTDLFPVLVNVETSWQDELQMVAGWTHNCFLLSHENNLQKAELIGSLDVAQTATFQAVAHASEVTGAELERNHSKESIKATAWNNRLKDLFQKRLIRRKKRGREQVYSPVIAEVLSNG